MVYYNLKIIVTPLVNMDSNATYEKISKLISQAMLLDENLKILHETNNYKMYTFCNLYPVEKDKIYKQGKPYTFDLRTLDMKFAIKMKQLLTLITNKDFKVLLANLENSQQRKINKLITLTPAVITTPSSGYDIQDNLDLVKKRINDGAQKKYFMLKGEKVNVDCIQSIRKINHKPIKIPYKNIAFLGNKFEIEINEDKISQDLAYILLATGMLEKNTIGCGFCKAM